MATAKRPWSINCARSPAADEWPRVAPAIQRIQRNRQVKREVKQQRRRGRTVRQACMDVASGHGLSPNTVQAIFYDLR
jgi:hypothetical protein